ncbi:MAG: putative porin [Bacteroidia bacterium]|nr:putative porin [Bacteroidia bacterium]
MRLFSLIIILTLSTAIASAQDSLSGRAAPQYKMEHDFFWMEAMKRTIDTSLFEAELYNPMVKKYRLYQDLGNIGSPAQSLIFNPEAANGFQLGTEAMQQYYKRSEDTRFYSATKPYTDIQYVQGSKELLFLDLLLTKNVSKRWNIGVDFRRISSLGYYVNQKSSIWSTRVFSSYESGNKRYILLNSLIWNKGYVEMNGGLIQDSSYEALSGANKQVGVNLQGNGPDGSGGPRNLFRNTSFHTAQYWYFGKYLTTVNGNDTSKQFIQRAGIKHTIDVERYSFLYRDKNLLNKDFYPAFYFDTTQTYDSLHQFMVQNSITLFNGSYINDSSFRKFGTFLTLHHQYIEIYQRTSNTKYNNVLVNFNFQPGSEFHTYKIYPRTDITYCGLGYNKGDYSATSALQYFSNKVYYALEAAATAKEQDYLINHFVSNHYLWENDFKKTQSKHLGLIIQENRSHAWNNPNGGWKLKTNLNIVNQFVYFDTTALPVQHNKQLQIITASLSKSLRFGNFWLHNQLWYQYTDNKQVIRLPELGLFERFYYEKRLFKKVMLAQIGVDVSFYTAYYAKEFNPVTRQFQLQNKVRTGNYPIVDVFFNMQLKRAILFFKFDHANADLSGNNSYAGPHQPLPYRSFRLGIRWRMFD